MEVQFVDEYEDVLHTESMDTFPRVSDSVLFEDDTYRVKSVRWDIVKNIVIVELSSTPEKIVKESAPEINNQHEIRFALQKAERALKETKTLRNEFLNMRQFIKTLQTKK